MNENDNSFEIQQYFENILIELKITLPSKILTKYYLNKIIENPKNVFEIMKKLDNEVYKQIDWQNTEQKYIGEELKIEHLYT